MAVDMRVKYDIALRSRAAELLSSGAGHRAVAAELGLPVRTAKGWQRIYGAVGTEGLLGMGEKSTAYGYETKAAAARAVVEDGMTRAQAMARFGVASEAPISRWVKAYREGGAEALRPKPKGRPKGPSANPGGTTREEELERQVRRLEAEVAYLKKSIALKAEKRSRTARRRSS